MRRAMAEAEVGDDYYGDDPTVRALEEETAEVLGKEAALFVPTGSMGNEVAVAVHTKPGDVIALDAQAHMITVEERAVVGLLRRRFQELAGDRGRLDAPVVQRALEAHDVRPAMLEAENTFNRHSGSIYDLDALRSLGALAASVGARFHLDGARLWNASAATGVPVASYAACADSVMVCYSKGLGAPIGSAVAGSAAFVKEARSARRMFGGGMRQVGIVAAGARHALRHHRDRLVDDHRRARRLAEALAEMGAFQIDPLEVETNIVMARAARQPDRVPAFVESASRHGARILAFGGPGAFRAITHLDVDDADLERAIVALRAAVAETWGTPS